MARFRIADGRPRIGFAQLFIGKAGIFGDRLALRRQEARTERPDMVCPVLLQPERENVIRLTLGENGRERIRVYRHVRPVKLFHAWLLSDILYEGEPVPVKFLVNEPQTEPVRVDFLNGKVRCRYKNEIIELPCQTIKSPWSKP